MSFLDKVLAKCTKCQQKYLLPAMIVPTTHKHGDLYGLCTTCDSVVVVGKFDAEFLDEIRVTQFDDSTPSFNAVSSNPSAVPTNDQVRLEGTTEGKRGRGRPTLIYRAA